MELTTLPWSLGAPEVLPGAVGREIGCVRMAHLVPGYKSAEDAIAEWTWLEEHAWFSSDIADGRDMVLRLDDLPTEAPPASLLPVVQDALRQNLVYLCIHEAPEAMLQRKLQ